MGSLATVLMQRSRCREIITLLRTPSRGHCLHKGTYDLTDALRVTRGCSLHRGRKGRNVSDQKLGDSFCGMTGNLEGGSQGQCAAYNNWLAVVQASNFNSYNKYWTGSRKTDDSVTFCEPSVGHE